jgi:SRSO17 transposase
MKAYTPHFLSYRKDTSDKASQYIQGLLKRDLRKNAESIAVAVPGAKAQNLQQFISDSSWNYQPVMNLTAANANELLGDDENAALLIDESAIPKKGKKSVGVARQWLGCLGKTDNGQVGVFAALSNGNHACLVNTKLYLPKEWTADKKRCDEAHIPKDKREFKTKEELAIELIDEAIALDMQFGHIGADAGYGKGLEFMLAIQSRKKEFMVDVACDQRVYIKSPKPVIPEKMGIRGRNPTEYEATTDAIRVDKLISGIAATKWKNIVVRDSTKGPIVYEVYCQRVFVWQKNMEDKPCQWWLVVRRDPESKSDYKYSLSNAVAESTIEQLAKKQGQRYWIEKTFETAKGECGLDHYEVRGWDGWHRHMALVMIAQFFLLQEKMLNENEIPLLSERDIMELLALFLPQKEQTIETVLKEMKERHAQRAKATKSMTNKVYEKWKSIITL